MEENEPLPDHLRCKRTDGRQWRCNRRVMDDKKLCEIHHLQGRHRQYRRKVPESLKLQRKYKKKSTGNADSGTFNSEIRAQTEDRLSRLVKLGKPMKRKKSIGRESEVIEEAVKRMKVKRGDLQLDLIRMVLRREVDKRKKKKKKKKKKNKIVVQEINTDNENDSSNSEEEFMRDLPNGLMAISPAKHYGNVGATTSSSTPCDIKIGASDFNAVSRRRFRSKNIEPVPIGALQIVPFKKDMVKLRRGKRKKCHWCRRSGLKTLIKCSSCRKQFYCMDCIKEQYFNMIEEINIACPVCRGTCSCKACEAIQFRDTECKGFSKDNSKVNKVLHFHYLICMLLPVLKQINEDQSFELEMEAKIKGQNLSDVQIQQVDVNCNKQCCCNNCKMSIVDFHRSCPSCSYNLCLNCCRDIFQGSFKALLCKCPSRRKACIAERQLSEMKSVCFSKRNSGNKYFDSSMLFPDWTKVPDYNGGIPCPPPEFGGCGDSLLGLNCVLPSTWTKELETSAEEIVGCYELPENLDIVSPCSLCVGTMDCEANEIMQLQEAATREDSNDNFLYYPHFVDVHSDNLEHFQKHWSKGQPVVVRNVLLGSSDLSWDPIVMFCTYLKNNAAKSENEQATDWFDWFEVEIGIKQLFMGSFKGPKHANVWHERLKLKGWLSSLLFKEHFPAHYSEILRALPLPEYMDPVSGILNIAAELPQDITKPDLGPCVYISYSSGEDLLQADSVTKLRYDSHDVVNILAHTTDAPVSAEQLNYIRKLMKKHEQQSGATPLEGKNVEELELHDMITEEMTLHKKVTQVSWFSAASHEAQSLYHKSRDTFLDGESESDSDSDSDTDTDTEVSKFFFGPVKSCRTSENRKFSGSHKDDSNNFGKQKLADSCGALWDVFRRQDVPKLVEYIKRHSNEFAQTYGFRRHVGHPILDQNIFLDVTHKMRLKEEFKIEPWTFEQHVGEAVIIPAGCPYQIKNIKSCVNVVLDFVSPENVTECFQLVDELRLLPDNHKAKVDSFEVKKMALHSISRAIKEIRELTCPENSGELNDQQAGLVAENGG